MSSGGTFDLRKLEERLSELNDRVAAPDFWNDPDRAQQLTQERGVVERQLKEIKRLGQNLDDAEAYIELGAEMGEDEVRADLEGALAATRAELDRLEFRRMLGAEHDRFDAIVTINAGAGGTESQDWAQMLFRMYLRYCEKQGWATELMDEQSGEEAGIKSASFLVKGEYAFGFLKAETGVHRLVRISPFDANARRHTSFSSVYVVPDLDDSIEIVINEKDLRIDTYRASGAGGQHVNRTDSAVRITHIPSGVVVACQAERSQIKNRDRAMKALKSRLYEEERRKREEIQAQANSEKSEIGFGSQIRSYVLAPYQMVKDLRTQHESGNPNAVLDGDLQPFVEAYLLKTAGGKKTSEDDPAF